MAVSSADAVSERAQELPKPEPHVLVLFGATGDLARRKLIPGLFHLEQVGMLPEDYRIVGASLDELDDEASEARPGRARRVLPHGRRRHWKAFSERLSYVPSKADALAAGVARAEGRSEARRAACTTCRSRRPPRARSSARSARRG